MAAFAVGLRCGYYPATCSDELIKLIKKKADDNGVGLVMHVVQFVRRSSGVSLEDMACPDVEPMAKLDALGPNMVLIHMGWAITEGNRAQHEA